MDRRENEFECHYLTDIVTFSLPEELCSLRDDGSLSQLWEELLDTDAQTELQNARVINWAPGIASHLYALWNRNAGDCLLDSVLQATWGVFDSGNRMREAMTASLTDAAPLFYPLWCSYESHQALNLGYQLTDSQLRAEWGDLLMRAAQPGRSLDQLHVWALSHVLRRPIIVYGVKSVKSFRGEEVGIERFEGVYLPLLWERHFCHRSPIALGYTRGHFSALVTIANAGEEEDFENTVAYLPLMDYEGKCLPVHYTDTHQVSVPDLGTWLDLYRCRSGVLLARQQLHKPPLAVAQMVEEWLNYYRTKIQMEATPFARVFPGGETN